MGCILAAQHVHRAERQVTIDGHKRPGDVVIVERKGVVISKIRCYGEMHCKWIKTTIRKHGQCRMCKCDERENCESVVTGGRSSTRKHQVFCTLLHQGCGF